MDEEKLNEMLSHLHAPEPSKDKQDQALASAMTAFDKKIEKIAQGKSSAGRLTDIRNPLTYVRRFIMQKKYVLSGMTGAVSVIALVGVLGTPYIKDVMYGSISAGSSGAAFTGVTGPSQNNLSNMSANVVTSSSGLPSIASTLSNIAQPGKALGTMLGAAASESAGAAVTMQRGDAPSFAGVTANKVIGREMMLAPASMPVIMADMDQRYYKDVGRDKFEHAEENPVKAVSADPVSTFSIDVDTASYSFVRRMLNNTALPPKDAVRPEEMINYFDYNYPAADTTEQPFKPTIAVYDSPWKQGNKLVHIGIKGYTVNLAEKPRSNLVFLVDVSGSMNSPDKLPLVINSLKMLVNSSLQPDDTVGLVVYAGSAGTVLEPTKVSEKQKILEALERLQSGGSTAGGEGIRQAYNLAEQHMVKDGVNRVILATDGDFNVGITNQKDLKDFIERKRDTGISLSVLGFGAGNYNDSMMQALAQNGNGNAAYIDTLSEARKVLVEEAGSTLLTIAKDVKIQVEFNPAAVKEYRLVGYETRALKREDFNNDKVDAGEIGSGHAVTAIYDVTPVGGQSMVDGLRYAAEKDAAKADDKKGGTGEYAFLKIRYKLPKEDTSRLIERPITGEDERAFDQLPEDIRFASAVAGFSQLLKGSKYTGSLTYDKVIEIADKSRGKDTFGYRVEFVNLVRQAKTAAAMLPAEQPNRGILPMQQ